MPPLLRTRNFHHKENSISIGRCRDRTFYLCTTTFYHNQNENERGKKKKGKCWVLVPDHLKNENQCSRWTSCTGLAQMRERLHKALLFTLAHTHTNTHAHTHNLFLHLAELAMLERPNVWEHLHWHMWTLANLGNAVQICDGSRGDLTCGHLNSCRTLFLVFYTLSKMKAEVVNKIKLIIYGFQNR